MVNIKTNIFILFLFFCSLQCAAQVSIVTPKANQIFNINESFKISWNHAAFTNSYKVQLSSDSTFSNLIFSVNTNNTFYSTSINQLGVFYIRVKSNNDLVWSQTIQINSIDINTVNGLIAWFSADSLVNKSSGQVDSWTDIKNNTRIASQSNFGNKPYLENLCLLNNKPALTFNGNAFLDLNIPITSSSFSLYTLRNLRAGNPVAQYPFGTNPGAGFYAEQAGAAQGPGVFFFSGINFFASEPVRDTTFCLYLNSPRSISRNNNIIANSSSNITNPNIVKIGSRTDGFPFSGTMAEFLYFDRVLDSTSNTTITQYFSRKYAPPVDLGLDTILGTSFCDSVTISAACYTSYLWSNGKKTQSIKVLPNNSYSVTVRDILGNTSTDEISVFPYKRLGNKTIAVCKGEIITIDLKTPPSFSVLWNDNTTDKIKTINSTGQYTVKVTDAIGCFVFDTINVIVDEPTLSPVPDAGNNLTLCEGEKLFLISPTAFDSILWSNGSTENFIAVTNPGNYNVYGITNSGCVINQPFNITIAGKAPVAQFAVPPACQDAPLTFTDTSKAPAGNTIQNWSWTFSNNSTSTIQNPTTLFSSLGTQTVTLKITTNVGCTDSIAKTFTVNRKPVPSFFNLLSCAGNATTFVDQSIANAASLINWKWDFGGLGTSNGMQNPGFSFPAAGNYLVTLKATNSNGCSDTISRQVAVNSSPNANFSFDSVCGKTPVNLKFLATVQAPSVIPDINWGSWDFGDGTIETAIRNPQHIYNEPGTYDVKLVVKSSNQCLDTVVKQIKVFDFPVVDFTISPTQCVGKSIQFTDISATPDGTPISKWNWYFSGLATDTIQHPKYTFNSQGNYTIQLTAQNTVGCSNTKLRSIAVSSPPIPKFTFSPQNGLPPLNVNYVNQSATNGNYLWNYGDGGPFIAGYNPPPHVYTAIGTYPIKLVATDFRGCTDTLTKFILVDRAYLDGVMASISLIPTSGDFYKVQVSIINNSNVEITALGLSLQLGGGAEIRENWTGSLLPGQTTVYLFNGELRAGDNSIPVVCASIDNVNNNATENRTDNNTTCKEIKVGGFDILTIFPNPAYDNNINFGVMLPAAGKVNIRFVDVLGQQMYQSDFDGIKGYNQFAMPIGMLNATVYVAEVSFDGEVVRKKFMRKNR